MRGLLIKDIHLLMRQKNMLLLAALLLVLLSRNGLEFTLGYFVFICFVLGNTTVTYDEADRGLTFLMTFPVSRNTYVFEKYVLTLCPGIVATAIAVGIQFAAARLQGQPADSLKIVISCFGVFFVCSLVVAVFFPLEMLGKEKAQMILNIVCAVFGVGLVMLMKNEAALECILAYAMNAVEAIGKVGFSTWAFGIWAVAMLCSMFCSMLIMKKKEF